MIVEGFVDALARKLREHRERLTETIAFGQVSDWEDYKHITGTIRGLALAENELNDLAKKARAENE